MWFTFWRPLVESFTKGVLEGQTKPLDYRGAFAQYCLLIALILMLAWLNTSLLLFYGLPLNALTYFITRYVDYLNHYGCDEESGNACELANNSLSPAFNRLTHNFGYHSAHYIKPGAG